MIVGGKFFTVKKKKQAHSSVIMTHIYEMLLGDSLVSVVIMAGAEGTVQRRSRH